MARIDAWFDERGWSPLSYQRQVWSAYLAGESGLIHAATGTGKTLAAWMGPLAEWLMERPAIIPETNRSPRARAPKRSTTPPLRVLWITPLRALATDTGEALTEAARGLEIDWSIETRTGDTPAAMRARQGRRLPTVLVTTPESLTLLLTRADAAEQLRDLRLVVVDEWHELFGTKRGVQVELALARLRTLTPDLRLWGLSATIGNLHAALDALVGIGARPRPARIIQGAEPKRIDVDALIPPVVERFPWAGHLNTMIRDQVVRALDESESAIVFTNTRSQAEIWYQALLDARPAWAGAIALHHGSLDHRTRLWVEDGLRNHRLRCVVATSSLDLGVDFSPVDRVIQIGSPKSVARLVQRAGRSGHRPGAASRITCAPTQVLELVEVAAARDAMMAGSVEARQPVDRPIDVLTQHLVTVALGGGFTSRELLAEVRTTRAYATLTDDEWAWALAFVSHGGEALRAYAEHARVTRDGERFVVSDATIARRHRMSIGTIVGDGTIGVQYLRGARLGSVEESFLARLRPGEHFIFAGKALELVRVRDMTAWVRRAPSVRGAIPRWAGSRMPLSSELASALRARLAEAARGEYRGAELAAVRPVLEVQARWSRIPAADELLIERVRTREGWHFFFFPFEGRLVHEGLAALLAWRLARLVPITFTTSCNDYGFELLSPEPVPLDQALANGLLSGGALLDHLSAALNASEMARRQFREIARVAGLVFPGFPHAGKTARQLQASSGLYFDVFERYDAGNRLVSQAYDEVLERQMERSRLGRALDRMSRSRLLITAPQRPTPLAFPLLVDRTRGRISSETLADRVRRMQLVLERAAG